MASSDGHGTGQAVLRATRILIIIPHPYEPPWNEGVKNLTRRIVKFFENHGEIVCVASTSGLSTAGFNNETEGKSDKILSLPRNATLFFNVVRAARSFRPDITLLFTSCGSLLGLKTMIFRRLVNGPLVIYVSGLRPHIFGFNLFLNPERVLVGSPFLQRYFPEAPVIYPFAPLHLRPVASRSRSSIQTASIESARRFLFLGTWEPGRGLEDLLQATAIARREVPVELTLALNNYHHKYSRSKLKQLIGELGLGQTVTLQETADINTLYQETDVVIIPRNRPVRMSFPLRIIESLTMRKPMIVTTMCDMDQLIRGCGLAAAPGNPESLAQAMIKLTTDGKLYQQFVDNCDARVEQYDSEQSLERLYGELKNACGR